jgi:hypothetical protein
MQTFEDRKRTIRDLLAYYAGAHVFALASRFQSLNLSRSVQHFHPHGWRRRALIRSIFGAWLAKRD